MNQHFDLYFVSLDMDLQSKKIKLAQLILGLENTQVLDKVARLLESNSQEQVDLTERELRDIELAKKQLAEGKEISYDDFLKKVS
jgi:3-methyladenine DNA glycosylase AlkD